jgi:hypothetical protein
MNRNEHLDWCKKRAIAYIDAGDLNGAFTSMISDLGKHSETASHAGIELGAGMLFSGIMLTEDLMRKYIEDFN